MNAIEFFLCICQAEIHVLKAHGNMDTKNHA